MRPVAALTAALVALATWTCPAPASAQDMGFTLVAPEAPSVAQTAQRLRPDIGPGEPARMLVIGDSLAQGFGTLLVQRADARELQIEAVNRGRPSTGLSRADYYNWPQAFAEMVAARRPDIVVVHFGANDMQSVLAPEGRTSLGSDGWEEAYRTQIRKVLDVAAGAGAVVYWLGPAPDGNSGLGRHLVRVNPYYEEEATAAGATYFPLTPLTAPNGTFEQTVTIDGTRIGMRTSDGSHFTPRGYAFVADAVLDDLVERFPQLGAAAGTPTLASAATEDPLGAALQ